MPVSVQKDHEKERLAAECNGMEAVEGEVERDPFVGCSGPQDAHSGLVKAHEVIALQGNKVCYSPSQSS